MNRERPRRRAARGGAAPARARAAPAARAGPSRRWPWWLAPAAAALAAGLLHVRSLAAPFFADDWLFLDLVRSRSLVGSLVAHDPIGNYFRPLGRAVWFWALAHASGESPVVFHVANLALWLGSVLLVWALARDLAGARAGAIAAGLYALTQAADVPVRWASGSQDLLAVTLALSATLLLVRGRRWWSALLFALAPLAKEVVALAVVPAVLLARRRGEPWRAVVVRAWPALAGTAVWAALAAVAAAQRQGTSPLTFNALAPVAALVNLVRTQLGMEWGTGAESAGAWFVPVTVVALVLGAIAVASTGTGGSAQARERGDVVLGAVAWAVVGAVPVAFVAPIWSAYFYLYALAGTALLAGTLLSRVPVWAAVAVVLVVGGALRRAGRLHEFATEPAAFASESHVNDFYLYRGMRVISRGVGDLRRLHPHPEPRSTFFFTGVPSFAGFQVGDGPLVRGVYRDSSLRSYYLTDLTRERMRRGPAWFVFYSPDSGHFSDQSADPDLFLRVALGHLLNGREDAAREAMEIGRSREHVSRNSWYLAAFMALDQGDHATASRCFAQAGCREAADGDAALSVGNQLAAAGDTTGAIQLLSRAVGQYVLDARIHARIADLKLTQWKGAGNAALEAYVARVLSPDDGTAWRRWAFALYWQSRFTQAHDALEKYYRLSPQLASNDPGAADLRQLLPRMMPGGDLLQGALQREGSR